MTEVDTELDTRLKELEIPIDYGSVFSFDSYEPASQRLKRHNYAFDRMVMVLATQLYVNAEEGNFSTTFRLSGGGKDIADFTCRVVKFIKPVARGEEHTFYCFVPVYKTVKVGAPFGDRLSDDEVLERVEIECIPLGPRFVGYYSFTAHGFSTRYVVHKVIARFRS